MNDPDEPIRVVIVAQALSMRLGLRALLTGVADIEVIGESSGLDELGRTLSRVQVCLLAGRAAASWRAFPEGSFAVLLLLDERPERLPGLTGGPAWGLLPLDSSASELAAAIRALAAGLFVASPGWMTAGLSPMLALDEPDRPAQDLTRREAEVLQQLALGLANKQIAVALGLSENTVKFHISAIYDKLGASNRAEAVRLGARQGWISL